MKELETLVEEAIDSQKNLSESDREKMKQLALDMFENGKNPLEVLGISAEGLESLYNHGYHLYQSGKYGFAGYLFRMLALLNPNDPRFYMGIGACLHRLEDFETACFFYDIASGLDLNNPMAPYYRSDCEIRLTKIKDAEYSLKEVMLRGGKLKGFEALVDRARLTLETLQQEHSINRK